MVDTELTAVLVRLLRTSNTPGAAVAMVGDADLYWIRTSGVAHVHTREPLRPESVFGVASLSKPVFAYGALVLCHRGGLDLDVPLRSYFPAPYEQDDPQLARITARMVLSHTTGLPNERRAGAALRVRRPPGTAFGYSGEGYRYLQHVVEHITDQPLDTYLCAAVFAPLGMESSSYVWRAQDDTTVVTGHDHLGRPLPRWTPATGHAGASLVTTPADYTRFLRAMLDPQGMHAPLTEQQIVAMLAPQVRVTAAVSWGLGWGLHATDAGTAFWHWGQNGDGFTCFTLGCRATKAALVVMTNGLNGFNVYEPLVHLLLPGHDPVFAFVRAVDRYMH